ncbi:FAD-dependent oxidoreductase [Peptostreptococcus equinus]|uniref:FAD-dependent oxidoreductase n=1 Tax=Peptostreptococcus equinus TaxID=3003601 RepID=A0ABY7JSD6_9FIRM|nr:FAD-dependent oxidoreductase [Peptostreptococcus sp. CBA3647]WAW14852.1 FAD-dependent oxidoreductase [Peptostreptococcus sp. CBA3647]
MSYVEKIKYGEKAEKDYDIRTAMEEATRCLLCEDAPCSKGCPAGTNPGKFIRSIRLRNFKGAAETIRENNILGGCCSLVCPYGNLCEKECARCGIDEPIKIGKLQKFAIDHEKESGMQILKASEKKLGKKVACIGSGPASLACAAKLAQEGVDVTIFEQFEKAGGVLTYGITPSRLPQEVIEHDIDQVRNLGVEFKFNTRIEGKEGIENLLKEYDAVFVGVGLWSGSIPDIKGKDSKGVYSAQEFLKKARENNGDIEIGEDVLIIGGGDVAMDCASTSKQVGAKNVAIVYRRTIEEAPSYYEEIRYVQSMGIPIHTRFAPEEILADSNGNVEKMLFKSWDNVSEMTMKADTVVFAIGQKPSEDYKDVEYPKGVFVNGDIVNGGLTVVQAVADGKQSAEEILNYLA